MTARPADREPQAHLLLLVGLSGLPGREALAAALRVTHRVSVVYVTGWVDPQPLHLQWERSARGVEFRTVEDLDAAVAAAEQIHARQPLHGVVTYSERLLRPHAQIAARLGLRGNTPAAVAVAQSKLRQRLAFAERGVPSPRFAVLREDTDVDAAVAHTGLPAVFKPSFGAGSQGVEAADTAEDVQRLLREGLAADTALTRLQQERVFVLEERMDIQGGPQSPYADYVSVESLLFDGEAEHLAVTDRVRLTHGYVEEGLVLPTRLDSRTTAAVVECVDRALQAIGLTDGATHTEVALTTSGPKIIEVNARAGGPIPTMLHAAAGYDYAAATAWVALGQRSPGPGAFTRATWFRFLPIPAGQWRIAAQATEQELRDRFPQLVQLNLRFRVGQFVSRHGSQHLSTFTVCAADLEQARAVSLEVEQALGIRLEPAEQGVPAQPLPADNLR